MIRWQTTTDLPQALILGKYNSRQRDLRGDSAAKKWKKIRIPESYAIRDNFFLSLLTAFPPRMVGPEDGNTETRKQQKRWGNALISWNELDHLRGPHFLWTRMRFAYLAQKPIGAHLPECSCGLLWGRRSLGQTISVEMHVHALFECSLMYTMQCNWSSGCRKKTFIAATRRWAIVMRISIDG